MALFAGKQENKIDAKGRVSLPSFIRSELPVAAHDGRTDKPSDLDQRSHRIIYLYPSPTHQQVVEGCDRAGLEAMRARIDRLPRLSAEREYLTELFFAEATSLMIDENGRIQMPTELANHARLAGTCLFVGRNDVFEIWHKPIYDEVRRSSAADPERLAKAFAALDWQLES